uniref:Uncharacterized protein n=1 Tax=Candidatus Kentrum sp. LFY TaxID=2126342 RepID=A0A450WED3_9GAMM|nr:MAG: hypothetical protein BECKLFY1418C_GA0070996_101436 [Candidatus Kentron sp. LFY]
MKYFNTAGPVIPEDHYNIPALFFYFPLGIPTSQDGNGIDFEGANVSLFDPMEDLRYCPLVIDFPWHSVHFMGYRLRAKPAEMDRRSFPSNRQGSSGHR